MFFWNPNAGAMKLTGIPSTSQSASMTAVVSGEVRPGSSSMESSRRYLLPASVVKAPCLAARYFSSRPFIFCIAGQTAQMRAVEGPVVQGQARGRDSGLSDPGDDRRVDLGETGAGLFRASSGERSKVM